MVLKLIVLTVTDCGIPSWLGGPCECNMDLRSTILYRNQTLRIIFNMVVPAGQ